MSNTQNTPHDFDGTAREYVVINQLNPKEYEHPLDAKFLNVLKLNKGFDLLAKFMIEYGIERQYTIQYTGSNIRVTERNMPYLYNCVKEAAERLDVEMPPVYVEQSPYLNAFTTGSKNPILVLHDCVIDRLTRPELLCLIGHELGHIKSEHLQHRMMGRTLFSLVEEASFRLPIPVIGDILSTGLELTFWQWMRMSEITADRAGLLVCQDLGAAISLQAKLAGYPISMYNSIDLNGFVEQAMEFEDLINQDTFNFLYTLEYSLGQSHPWSVLRAKELLLWVESGEYTRILMRNSTWLKHELNRRIQAVEKAEMNHRRRVLDAKHAKELHELNMDEKAMLKRQGQDKKGFEKFIHLGVAGVKDAFAKRDEGTAEHKQAATENTKEKLDKAQAEEASMRTLFNDVDARAIEASVDQAMGTLPRLSQKPALETVVLTIESEELPQLPEAELSEDQNNTPDQD